MAITTIPFMLNPSAITTADLSSLFAMVTPANISVTAGGRNSGSSLHFINTGGNVTTNAFWGLPTNMATVSIAQCVNISRVPTSNAGLLAWQWMDSGTIQCSAGFNTSGQVEVKRGVFASGTSLGVASSTYTAGVQDHWEVLITIHNTAGVVKVWKNEALVLNLSSQNTRSTSANQVNAVSWGGGTNSSGEASTTIDYSDIHVADDQVGDKRLLILTPNGAGNSTQMTNNGGASNNASVADVTQDGDTTYVSDATVGHIDTYAMSNVTGSPTILAVGSWHMAKKTDAGVRQYQPALRISSTNYFGSSQYPSAGGYGYGQYVWLVSPATAVAFTSTELNGAEFGQKTSA